MISWTNIYVSGLFSLSEALYYNWTIPCQVPTIHFNSFKVKIRVDVTCTRWIYPLVLLAPMFLKNTVRFFLILTKITQIQCLFPTVSVCMCFNAEARLTVCVCVSFESRICMYVKNINNCMSDQLYQSSIDFPVSFLCWLSYWFLSAVNAHKSMLRLMIATNNSRRSFQLKGLINDVLIPTICMIFLARALSMRQNSSNCRTLHLSWQWMRCFPLIKCAMFKIQSESHWRVNWRDSMGRLQLWLKSAYKMVLKHTLC